MVSLCCAVWCEATNGAAGQWHVVLLFLLVVGPWVACRTLIHAFVVDIQSLEQDLLRSGSTTGALGCFQFCWYSQFLRRQQFLQKATTHTHKWT